MKPKRNAGAVERRVGRRTRKEWLWAFRSLLLNIRRNTRSTAIAPYGPVSSPHARLNNK